MAELKSIQFKRGAAAALTTYLVGTDKLKDGEPAFEKDTGKLKIGNGVNDYADLPYIGGGGGGQDDRFVIVDPVAGQVLLYDSTLGKWVNKDLADDNAIIYLAQHGLTLKGYAQASQGQMLVKDVNDGLAWINPVSTATLDAKVAEANQAKVAAQGYANTASEKAVEAITAADSANTSAYNANRAATIGVQQTIDSKLKCMTLAEYNQLTEITPDCFYFLTL